jgi:CubicO group peptidase (beta-lactamase class C family)
LADPARSVGRPASTSLGEKIVKKHPTRRGPLFAGLLALGLAVPALAAEPAAAPATPVAQTAPAEDAPAATPPPGIGRLTAPDLEAWLDGFMPYALEKNDVAGAVVVVVKDGKVLLEKGYGYSDLAKHAPVDPRSTLFRPGSVSKLFTWTAVMQLVEQGKIDLDKDVNTYLDFTIPPYQGKPVTMRNIMTHTAGFEEAIRGLIATDPKGIQPLGDTLKHWVPQRVYAPGTTSAYSNYATAVAGYIVQRISGEPFDQYVANHIFLPLGMRHSSFSQPLPAALQPLVSKGYKQASDGIPKPYEYINLAPAGSLAATADDMAHFMIAHLQNGAYDGNRILRDETAVQMHTSATNTIQPLNRIMLGFYESSINGHRAIAHGGDTEWFHSDLQLFPDDNVGFFVSTNSAGKDGAARDIRAGLFDGFTKRYLPGPGPVGAGVDAATAKLHAQQIAGYYDVSRAAISNFMSLVYLLGEVKVVANPDGTISVPMLAGYSGAPKKWREISPYVWQDTTSNDRLAAEVVDGKVTRFSAEPIAAIEIFQRAAWWTTTPVLLPAFFGALLALLLTVVAWPVSALVRRHYGVRYPLSGTEASAHRRVRIASLAVLVTMSAMFGGVLLMMSDLDFMTPKQDALIVAGRVLALLVLPLGALVAVWNATVVLRGRRSWAAKAWSVVLALSCLVVLWVGYAYHVMGWTANY